MISLKKHRIVNKNFVDNRMISSLFIAKNVNWQLNDTTNTIGVMLGSDSRYYGDYSYGDSLREVNQILLVVSLS